MEHTNCNVLYVDRDLRQDRYLSTAQGGGADGEQWETKNIKENAKLLLEVFGEVHLISTGGACLSQWLELQDTSMLEMKPTLILIDTPFEDRRRESARSRSSSPNSGPSLEDDDDQNHEEDLYGLALLQRIVTESYLRNLSRLVVPIPVVVFPSSDCPDTSDSLSDARDEIANHKLLPESSGNERAANRRMLKRCLDLGATDVMASPMNVKCITNLEVHAYRAHREAVQDQKAQLELKRGRKRSWVGLTDEKPFAYLRETMVATLMNRICRVEPDNDDSVMAVKVSIPAERQAAISGFVGQWHFCAHDLSKDELLVAASLMFEHALSMPELKRWRIPTEDLHSFLLACRAAYNAFVPYHNFRHVVDVLQATFSFLIHIGSLPPFPKTNTHTPPTPKSPVAQLLDPFGALTLLITAIGHDVGHPGVNNGFLSKLNAPLAQLYNDRSVLESFHCAAYSQILRRHWPVAFEDAKMRSLMISSILATDMGLHFDYMAKMADLQRVLRDTNGPPAWDARTVDEYKALICALLIKCADISNVARQHDTALQWMHILSDEFSRQAAMETEIGIPTSLMAPPKKDMISLGKAQLGFMKLFAIPLFRGVAEIVPAMQYCVDELTTNQGIFENVVAEEKRKHGTECGGCSSEEFCSPGSDLLLAKQQASAQAKKAGGSAPTSLGSRTATEQEFVTRQVSPADKPAHVPTLNGDYKEVNGLNSSFDAVAEFAASDPFRANGGKNSCATNQRRSETTESSSLPYGEWNSGATSATTGKMPLSPSTQGTSIVSRDSMERPVSVPVTNTTAPESAKSQADLKIESHVLAAETVPINVHNDDEAKLKALEAELESCKTLRKKTSRFRINGLPFFRRHKGSNAPMSAAETAG